MNGNITRQLRPSFTDEYAIDKKGNIQALLQQEERQARDNASIVMERIMANSGPDKKVTSDDKQTKYWTLSLDQCHYWICYWQSARNHSAYGKSLRKWDMKGEGGGCLCYVIGLDFHVSTITAHCRHAWSFWIQGHVIGKCIQVLSTTFACSCYSGASWWQDQEIQGQEESIEWINATRQCRKFSNINQWIIQWWR